jgi:uncharacterized protein (DUF305 family)
MVPKPAGASLDSPPMHRALRWIVVVAALLAVLALVAGRVPRDAWPSLRPSQAAAAPGPIDIGFAQSMALHHQQAFAMSQLMLDDRPSGLTALARQIAYSQLLELGEMRGWLRLWDAPLMPSEVDMSWMLLGVTPPDERLLQYLLACSQSPTGMSGLATDDQLGALRTLEGIDRDRRYLELMLAHHLGGLPMARFAAAEATLRVVRDLAVRVVLEQNHEVTLIRQALAAIDAMAAQPSD